MAALGSVLLEPLRWFPAVSVIDPPLDTVSPSDPPHDLNQPNTALR